MASEWHVVALSTCADFQEGYVNPSQKREEYFGGPIKWLRATDLNNGFVYETSRTLSEIGYKSAGKSAQLFEPDSIGISKSGTIGRVGILKDYMCGNRAVINIRVKPDKAETLFIFYILIHNRLMIETLAMGSVQPNLYTSALGTLSFHLPPLQEQKTIANILVSLDNKIDLNRKMNATLEGMAQALFKSWFVDFDPVLDNALVAGKPIPDALAQRAEMRLAALANSTANRDLAQHFPAAFQFTEELGWIPEGWEVKGLGEIADNIRVSANPPLLPENTLYVGLEHIDKHSFTLYNWGLAQDVDSQKSKFENGDFLFGKLRPYFHKVCQVHTEGICSTDILVIRPKWKHYDGYVGCQIFESDFVEYANARSTGTRMPRASWKDMAKYQIALPVDQIVTIFNDLISPIREKCKRATVEAQTLAKLRDTLLPKLISGELRIPDAEKLVQEAL